MKKSLSLNLSTMVTLTLATYTAYYLLLHNNGLHSSIGSIIHYSHSLALRPHLIVLGLLPIYIAVMIFGAVLIGFYVGASVDYFFIRSIRKQPHPSTNISI